MHTSSVLAYHMHTSLLAYHMHTSSVLAYHMHTSLLAYHMPTSSVLAYPMHTSLLAYHMHTSSVLAYPMHTSLLAYHMHHSSGQIQATPKTQQSPPWLEFGQAFLNQNSSNCNRLHQHINCIPQAVRLLLWQSTISQAPPALLIYYCYYCTPVSTTFSWLKSSP
jgi:hypothetical protein